MVGLEGAGDGHTEVLGLVVVELGQLNSELLQVEAGHLLVQVLGQYVEADLVLVGGSVLGPELNLGENLELSIVL